MSYPRAAGGETVVQRIPVGPWNMNSYVVYDSQTKEGIVIDPGSDIDRIVEAMEEAQVQVHQIVLTHAHLDHMHEAEELHKQLGVELVAHNQAKALIDLTDVQNRMYGWELKEAPVVDRYLEEGDRVRFGQVELDVKHTPGHSPGSLSLIGEGFAITGDTVFKGGLGNTDLPFASREVLEETVKTKILTLDDSIVLHPGHGPETTVGAERTNLAIKD